MNTASVADRCTMSGRTQSVPHAEWVEAETCICNVCHNTVKFRVRGTDLPTLGPCPFPHRVDGTPTR